MASEIDLGGTIYISSKRAAELTGYTQDYIGQLARGAHIQAQRVSGHWYVVEKSLFEYKEKAEQYKPTPPSSESRVDTTEASVVFDGAEFISAQRASKISGYHADYVSQLARSNKIPGRQVGNRWFVDEKSILAHKKEKDSLLAAVQADSVGLARNKADSEAPAGRPLHFVYRESAIPQEPIPEIESKINSEPENKYDLGIESPEMSKFIPIRVLKTDNTVYPRNAEISPKMKIAPRSNNLSLLLGTVLLLVVISVVGYYGFKVFFSTNESVLSQQYDGIVSSPDESDGILSSIRAFLMNGLSRELIYRK